jgi:quercetin dioxygenase-like cupin family protein
VGGYFAYGGDGTDKSAVVCFAVPPGKRLGRHTDTAEETQFILSGSGDLLLDDRLSS